MAGNDTEVEVLDDISKSSKVTCIDCWMQGQNMVGFIFDARPKPYRDSMWYFCWRHGYKGRGVVAAGRGSGAVAIGCGVVG